MSNENKLNYNPNENTELNLQENSQKKTKTAAKSTPPPTKQMSPGEQLMMLTVGKWLSKPIYIAARLGLPGLLANGPMTVEQLAEKCEADASILFRVMRALASVGIFSQTTGRTFQLTPMAELLGTGAMSSMAQMFNAPWNDLAWTKLENCLLTGENAFHSAHGVRFPQWLEENPEEADMLWQANGHKAAGWAEKIMESYDFSGTSRLVDVGGGYGKWIASVLESHPELQGIVAELPEVAAEARKFIRDKNLQHRCEVIDCDFFRQQVPGGGDLYFLSNILHDWSDEKCLQLLANVGRAMTDGSRLLLAEMIVPEGNGPSPAKLLDLEMLVLNDGKERTADEFASLLKRGDFKVERIISTSESISLIEATLI